jgi:hypothetical protein
MLCNPLLCRGLKSFRTSGFGAFLLPWHNLTTPRNTSEYYPKFDNRKNFSVKIAEIILESPYLLDKGR